MRKLGKGFGDTIVRGKRRSLAIKSDKLRRSFTQARVAPFFVLFVFGIGILIARLFWVTVVRGNYYRKISEENRVREEIVWSPRGIIYDRNRKALVLNKPVYRSAKCKVQSVKCKYYQQREVLRLETQGKASDIELFVSREYPFGQAFAHIVGYVGETDKKDVENGLRLGSLIGKTGLEESFDSALRGEEGKVLVETDALGKRIKELGKIEAKPGKDLYTTLDASLQRKAAEILGQAQDGTTSRPGAVVASKPNGEILLLYSSPSFNPNIFVRSGKLQVRKVLNNSSRPLFNRAVGGLYPPGSTFKPIVAVAALEAGAVDKNTVFLDKGFIRAGTFIFRNWYYTQYGKAEGKVDIVKGLARSVDTYFYKTGEAVGIDKIALWGRKFGLGRKSGIDIAGEAEGRMPDKKWKLKAKGERWYLGDTYHVAIGQGDILTTPLQVNLFTGAIANSGKLCKPKLVKSEQADKCEDLGLSEETLGLISEGMRKACEPGGTGFPFFEWEVESGKLKKRMRVACKTGTAEYGDPEKTHAWFTAYAPFKEPEIIVTVLLEGGGSGAYDAAPIAKEILGEYFRLN